VVIELRNYHHRYFRTEWKCFPWAVRYARERGGYGACIYAIAPTGRFFCLDREKLIEWEVRWYLNKRLPIHIIYHIPGRKVGCTKDIEHRMKLYEEYEGRRPKHYEILQILYRKTDQEAGDIEWQWADRFGYQRENHYTVTIKSASTRATNGNYSLTAEQRIARSKKAGTIAAGKGGRNRFAAMTPEEKSELARKASARSLEVTTPERRKEIGQAAGRIGGKNRFAAMTSEQRSELSRKANLKRWHPDRGL
jgi:general stress protein YciG